jgi:hypothetical protein
LIVCRRCGTLNLSPFYPKERHLEFGAALAEFLRNLAGFVVTLAVLLILFRIERQPVLLAALWGVGLMWGGWLAYKFSQLMGHADETSALEQARGYQAKILAVIEQSPTPRAEALAGQVAELVAAIEQLVERTDALRRDDIIRREVRQVPAAIKDLERRLADERDPAIKRQLNHTLVNRRRQQEALTGLQATISRAEIQIESTLSQLGAIYSQLLTSQSIDDVAGYQRLATDLGEEVQLLQDQLEALREVKLGSE